MNKPRLYGALITGVVGILVVLLLMFLLMPVRVPDDEDEILIVMSETEEEEDDFKLEEGNAGMGAEGMDGNARVEPSGTDDAVATTTNTDIATRINEETEVDLEQQRMAEEAERERVAAQERERQLQEQRNLINAKTATAFNNNKKVKDEGGTGSNAGSAGNGNNPIGSGYDADGNGWSLAGRGIGIGGLVRPVYKSNEEGRIVVTIRVNESGTVTDASIAQGTTIGDKSLRDATIAAAKKTKFTAGKGVAIGTLTYKFKIN